MTKIANPEAPSTRDVPGVPDDARWADRLLEPRDRHTKDLTQALQGGLSLGDNLNAEVRDLQVLDDVFTEIELKKLKGAPVGALLLWQERRGDVPAFDWQPVDVRKAEIYLSWPSAPEGAQRVRVVFLGS